jgi:hypothetical protein
MKTVEELASEYADDLYRSLDNDYDKNPGYEDIVSTYIAGFSEAQRWRDPKEESPENAGRVLVLHSTGYIHFGNESDGVWANELGFVIQEPISWRPIEIEIE